MKDGIFDVNQAGKLDTPGRILELKPPLLLRDVAGVRGGHICVDFGGGTGAFALPMAEIVGKAGTVYAVDNSPAMLEHIRSKGPPPNLELIEADVTATGLPDAIADVCLLSFILHEVKDATGLMAEAARVLKPGGRAVVVEWRADIDSPGPPRRRRIAKELVEKLFEQADMTFINYREWSPLHYVAIGEKPMKNERIEEIEDAIAELKERWPAHSVPPHMWQQLEDLEERLERAKKEAKVRNS